MEGILGGMLAISGIPSASQKSWSVEDKQEGPQPYLLLP